MFAQVHSPESLTPSELDAYLEKGWFRMGQTIFTTNFLYVRDEIFSTIWLRILLNDYSAESAQLKIVKKNSVFRTNISRATITLEKEELYALYKESVPFQASPSLNHLLLSGKDVNSIYETYEVTVWDGDRLIACGYFDLGNVASQGIVSFYHPSYKKYSLGKHLIYLKIQYSKELGLHYFYPGYFVPGNTHFDYKLSIGRPFLEYFQLRSGHWIPMDLFSDEDITCTVMHRKLSKVCTALSATNVYSQVLKYEFFDVNLRADLRDTGLFDFPVFLFFGKVIEGDSGPVLLLVFDVRDGQYHLMICVPSWKPIDTNPDIRFYSSYFLQPTREIIATSHEKEIIDIILILQN